MKQIAFVIASVALLLVIVLGGATMSHRTLRESEMESSLSDTVKSVLDDMVASQDYSLSDEDAVAAAFYESLLQKMNAGDDDDEDKNFELTADITGIDTDKGILAVHVVEKYTKPNGKIGEVECDATASFDVKKDITQHTISFYIDDVLWLTYEIADGEDFVAPPEPAVEGKTFVCWTDENATQEAVFPQTVTEDQIYYAVFR